MSGKVELKIPPMKAVKSDAVASHGYDAATKTMHVKFANGGHYKYVGVDPAVHAAFDEAKSKGKHFFANIRGKYPAEKVE